MGNSLVLMWFLRFVCFCRWLLDLYSPFVGSLDDFGMLGYFWGFNAVVGFLYLFKVRVLPGFPLCFDSASDRCVRMLCLLR